MRPNRFRYFGSLILVFTIIIAHTTVAQVTSVYQQEQKTYYADTSRACVPDQIFTVVEEMPYYDGSYFQLAIDLNDSLKLDKSINGKLFASVFVNCSDKAYSIKILLAKDLDEPTVTLLTKQILLLQNWKSGLQRKKKVDCHVVLAMEINKGKVIIDK